MLIQNIMADVVTGSAWLAAKAKEYELNLNSNHDAFHLQKYVMLDGPDPYFSEGVAMPD